MFRHRRLLAPTLLGLLSALNCTIFGQEGAAVGEAAVQPLDERAMESNAAREEAEEAPAEPDFAQPAQQSLLSWLLRSLGWRYTLLLPTSTFLSFVLLCLVLIYGRGWPAGAAAILLVPLPLLVGLMGTIDGLMSSYLVIAAADVAPKPSAVAEGASTALVTSLVGMCLMAPNYWLAVIGLLVRSIRSEGAKS